MCYNLKHTLGAVCRNCSGCPQVIGMVHAEVIAMKKPAGAEPILKEHPDNIPEFQHDKTFKKSPHRFFQ